MFDLKKTEKEALSFWKEHKIFKKSLDARKTAKRFVFFEGPPTANGLPHIGHFLTRVYKDLYGRYKTMRGFYVSRRAGWDTHGLPVEIEVEKELGFKSKKDIEKYGIAEFNKKAKESVWKYKTEWEEMTKRSGFWLDTDNPYATYENRYIESLWAIIKKIWDKKLLYLAHRVVHFCTRCGTALSSHEVAQGYRRITDKSVVVKFKIQNSKFKSIEGPIFILAWTTTPWTLPGNVALAVGKDIEYIKVVYDKNSYGLDKYPEGTYIFAKERAEYFGDLVLWSQSKETHDEYIDSKISFEDVLNRIETVKGTDLIGLEYEPLFDIKELKSDKSYRVYGADFVSTEEGTGVVHTAVMYGEDDYNLGTKLGLPKFHTVDEQGKFVGVGDTLDGKYVKDPVTEDLVIRELEIRNLALKVENFEHDYPFCWRCDTPLLYYAKESWFIKMSAVNKQLLKNNQKINWFPAHIKEGRFGQWLRESKDWAFSRERYWGTPLPVWQCQVGKLQTPNSKLQINSKFKIQNSKNGGCNNYLVVGSLEDLDQYRYKPKNEFYILRHGHSEKNKTGNSEEIISSRLESDKYHLTEDGKKQICKAARRLKKSGSVDMIVSSPFIRAGETAGIVADEFGLKVCLEPEIREFDHGSACEGRTERVCFITHENQDWKTKSPDGESWMELRRRMSRFLRDLDAKHKGKRILIVSHGDPLWLLETFTLGLNPDETISSRKYLSPSHGELKKLDLKNWPYDDDGELDLHRPYIDRIELKCQKCGGKMTKVPDLIDVWFDSGAMPYAQWHWPFDSQSSLRASPSGSMPIKFFDSKKMFKKQFPADFIVEAIDQTRGWFYTLLAIATLLGKGAPYKNVMVLGHTLDEKGQKMSKSKNNFVPAVELMDKYGTDVLRWYFLSSMAMGESKSVISKEIEDKQKGFLGTLDNCVRFYELYGKGSEMFTHDSKTNHFLDKWVLSKINGLVRDVSDGLDKYDPTSAARAIEKFVVEDLSNWWLRRSRKRKEALGLLRFTLLELAKVIAPFMPFVAEDIFARLNFAKQNLDGQVSSVHLCDWPKVNKKLIDGGLEKEMDQIREVVAAGLALRKEKQIKVRQPLNTSIVSDKYEFRGDSESIITGELNTMKIEYRSGMDKKIDFDFNLTRPLIYEGYVRELMRQIQDMRKEAGYRLDDKVFSQWHSDDKEVSEAICQWSDEIKKEVLLSEFLNGPHDKKAYDLEKEFELAPQRKIWVGIKK